MHWEQTLETLRRAGWGYGYGKCLDAATGSEIYLVNLRRGDKRLTIFKPTIEEAVTIISRLAQEDPSFRVKTDEETFTGRTAIFEDGRLAALLSNGAREMRSIAAMREACSLRGRSGRRTRRTAQEFRLSIGTESWPSLPRTTP